MHSGQTVSSGFPLSFPKDRNLCDQKSEPTLQSAPGLGWF